MKLNLFTIFILITYWSFFSSCGSRGNSDDEHIADNKSFIVEGKINADSGSVVLYPFYDEDYYSGKVKKFSSEVKNGEFYLLGNIDYPMGFTLEYENMYLSNLFVLEPGNQKMIVNIDENREVPFVQNAVMQEYRESYLTDYEGISKMRESYDIKWDSINNIYKRDVPDIVKFPLEQELNAIYSKSDSVLLNYVTKHPNSYLALWKLIRIFSFDGYNHTFYSTFQNFSPELKKSNPATVLKKKLDVSKVLAIGNPFPEMTLLDIKFDSVISIIPKDQEYVFVDFWYSSCSPCIAQFPELISIYENFKSKGFEIVGISSDRVEDKGKWLEAIVKYKLSWNEYLDADAVWCKKMAINKFPTNYLLNGDGVIIAKDLRPIELKEFLKGKI